MTSTRETTWTGNGRVVFQRVSRALLILQIEARGWRVLDLRHRADVVVHLVQEIGFQAAGEIEEEDSGRGTSHWRRGSRARR